MTDDSFVRNAVLTVRERVAAAAGRAGRDPAGIEILAVTKFHPFQAVSAAWEAGILPSGRAAYGKPRRNTPLSFATHPSARLDMIGHIQSNKAKRRASRCSLVCSPSILPISSSKLDRESPPPMIGAKSSSVSIPVKSPRKVSVARTNSIRPRVLFRPKTGGSSRGAS